MLAAGPGKPPLSQVYVATVGAVRPNGSYPTEALLRFRGGHGRTGSTAGGTAAQSGRQAAQSGSHDL